MAETSRAVKILLVEDNPGDVALVKMAFEEARTHNQILVAADGEEALDVLLCIVGDPAARLPDLILLDLNLPKKSGREVLREVKGDPVLKRIPVIMLSGSQSRDDVASTYDLGAAAYIVKPMGLDDFLERVSDIEAF